MEKAHERIVENATQMECQGKIAIPHWQQKGIIGPKGKVIRSVIEECSGVKIQLPSSGSSDEISIHRPKEAVESPVHSHGGNGKAPRRHHGRA